MIASRERADPLKHCALRRKWEARSMSRSRSSHARLLRKAAYPCTCASTRTAPIPTSNASRIALLGSAHKRAPPCESEKRLDPGCAAPQEDSFSRFEMTARDWPKAEAAGWGLRECKSAPASSAEKQGCALSGRRNAGARRSSRRARMSGRLRVAVVDDHPIVRDGIVAVIGTQADMHVAAAAESGRRAEAVADVVVLDWELPNVQGERAIAFLRDRFPGASIVYFLHTPAKSACVPRSMRARGLYSQRIAGEELLQAIRSCAPGEPYSDRACAAVCRSGDDAVTAREAEVLQLLARGFSNAQIAPRLDISERTVKFHVASLFARLGAKRRTQAIAIARERGLLPGDLSESTGRGPPPHTYVRHETSRRLDYRRIARPGRRAGARVGPARRRFRSNRPAR